MVKCFKKSFFLQLGIDPGCPRYLLVLATVVDGQSRAIRRREEVTAV